ncbi:C2H2-type domain-containing protein [Plasmodiophora brassicae]
MSSMDDEQMVSVGGIASSESNDGVRRSASVSSDPVQARSFAAVAHSQHQHHLLPASRGPNNRHRSLTLDTPPVVNANLVRQSFMPAFSLPQSTNTSAVPSPHSKPQPAIPPFHFQLPKDTAQRLVSAPFQSTAQTTAFPVARRLTLAQSDLPSYRKVQSGRSNPRARKRSANISELTFSHLYHPTEPPLNRIRVWKNERNLQFYDCDCGRRKAVQDLKKILNHVSKNCKLSGPVPAVLPDRASAATGSAASTRIASPITYDKAMDAAPYYHRKSLTTTTTTAADIAAASAILIMSQSVKNAQELARSTSSVASDDIDTDTDQS